MSDERTSFPVLEDFTTEVGKPWHQVAEGDDVASRNLGPVSGFKDASDQFKVARVAAENTDDVPTDDTLAAMPCKDSSGKIQYIPLNAQNKLPVSFDFGTEKNAHAKVLGVPSTQTEVCKITLTVDKVYEKVEALVSCTRDCLFELVQKDDAAEAVIADCLVGPGQYTFQIDMDALKFTAGSTGTQELILYGTQNQGPASDMHGTLACVELS